MPRRTGQTLMIYLQWIQLTAGTSIPVLDDARKLHHLEDPWITTVHDFLNITNSSIVIEGIRTPSSRREQDRNIMDIVIDSKRWTEQETKIINYWRMYLQVETVADMSNGTGTKVLTHIRNGQKSPTSTSKLLWPIQERPRSTATLKIWQSFIDEITYKGEQLKQQLGQWTNTENREWQVYYDEDYDTVYKRHNDKWREYDDAK